MNINEERLINGITDRIANVDKALQYVKDNFNIDSEYDADNCRVKLSCASAENALMLARAKEYIEEEVGADMVQVVFE